LGRSNIWAKGAKLLASAPQPCNKTNKWSGGFPLEGGTAIALRVRRLSSIGVMINLILGDKPNILRRNLTIIHEIVSSDLGILINTFFTGKISQAATVAPIIDQ
jgi:hypothetical protein